MKLFTEDYLLGLAEGAISEMTYFQSIDSDIHFKIEVEETKAVVKAVYTFCIGAEVENTPTDRGTLTTESGDYEFREWEFTILKSESENKYVDYIRDAYKYILNDVENQYEL